MGLRGAVELGCVLDHKHRQTMSKFCLIALISCFVAFTPLHSLYCIKEQLRTQRF